MYTTMRSIATGIATSPDYSGEVRLYISTRAQESVYAVSETGQVQTPYSPDILYLMDWSLLQGSLSGALPQNILCLNAASLARPDIPREHNIILLSSSITVGELRGIMQRYGSDEQQQVTFAPQLLESLYSGSLNRLCITASALCGNPLVFLSFNFRVTASSLLHSENPEIINIVERGAVTSEMVYFLHDKRNLPRINAGEILEMPGFSTRFMCLPILQGGIHIASILLFEDRVAIAESDRALLGHVAKCFRLLHPDLNTAGPTRLIYEYALVRSLEDTYAPGEFQGTRFTSLGYQFKSHMYMLVVNNALQVNVDNLRQQLNTLTGQVRRIVGNHGICTSYRDHVIALLNLDNDAPLPNILQDFKLLCARDALKVGISPRFSSGDELKRNYRFALDAVGIGAMIQPGEDVFSFADMRIYKFIATCSRTFSTADLLPEYLEKLIRFDRENNSNLLETLYYYVYTVKNTKKAAELMHIHRNTLLYRMEKIRTVIGLDVEDGDAFLQLMLAFKFLEFRAMQEGRQLCFKPIRPGDAPPPEEEH